MLIVAVSNLGISSPSSSLTSLCLPCRAIPHPFGALRLRGPRFQICSFRLLSQPRRISAMPIKSNRFSSVAYRVSSARCHIASGYRDSRPFIAIPCPCFSYLLCSGSTRIDSTPFLLFSRLFASRQRGSVSPLCLSRQGQSNPCQFDSTQIRADHLHSKSGLRTSNPCQFSAACADQCRTCSLPSRSMRHFAVSSLLFVHPVEASQIHCFSAQSTSPRSLLHLAYPSRFVSMPSSRLPSVSVRRHSTRGLSASLRGDSGLRTSLAMPFTSVPLHCLALRFGTPLRSAVSTICLSGLLHAVTTLRIFGIRRSLRSSSRLPSWPSLPSLQPLPSGPPRCGCRR